MGKVTADISMSRLEGGTTGKDAEVLDEAMSASGAVVVGKRMFDCAEGWGDEIQIHVAPLLLGAGRSLFDQSGNGQIELEATRVIESPAVTHLKYRVLK